MGFFTKDEVPKAPDMSPIINAAKDISAMSSGIAQETLDWAKAQFAQNQSDITGYVNNITSDSQAARNMIGNFQNIANSDEGVRRQALATAERAQKIADTQTGIQRTQLTAEQAQLRNQQDQLQMQRDFRQDQLAQQQKADQLYQQYSQTYEPAMARYMADAEAYGSADKVAQARAGAQANVGEQFQGARDAATRQLESYGINPASTRFAALDLGTRVKEAATKAAAGEAAARQREQDAFALRNQAIAQGQQLPTQATAATNAATGIGSNVNAAGTVANQAGSVGAQYGALANQAVGNQIAATSAGTQALNAATGANQAATQAQSGALAANTAAMGGEQAAGNLVNQTFQTGSQAIGTAPQYLGAANTGISTAGNTANQQYQNQLAQFKAEQSNSSGLGKLLGAVAPIAFGAATGGTGFAGSLAGNAIGSAMGGEYGGSASNPLPGLSASDYGSGASFADTYGIGGSNNPLAGTTRYSNTPGYNFFTGSYAEGGAIPMQTSPSNGQAVDDVPAQLTAGEFVMPRDVTAWYGEKFFQNLIQKAKMEQSKAQAKPAIGGAPSGPPAVVSRPAVGA